MEAQKSIVPTLQYFCSLLPLTLTPALSLQAVFFVHVGDAAEEGHRLLVAFVAHAVHFHGGDEDEIIGAQEFFRDDLVRLGIMLETAHMSGKDVHGLVI